MQIDGKQAHWWYKHILVNDTCNKMSYSAWDRNPSSPGYWQIAWNHIKTQPFLGIGGHNIPFTQKTIRWEKMDLKNRSKQTILLW